MRLGKRFALGFHVGSGIKILDQHIHRETFGYLRRIP